MLAVARWSSRLPYAKLFSIELEEFLAPILEHCLIVISSMPSAHSAVPNHRLVTRTPIPCRVAAPRRALVCRRARRST